MTEGSRREVDYESLWAILQAHLEEELESAYLNAIASFVRADYCLKAGHEERAREELERANRSLGQAVGLRNAVTTMPVKVRAARRSDDSMVVPRPSRLPLLRLVRDDPRAGSSR